MKTITLRRNKSYTSILLNECTKETFLESVKIKSELKEPAVIKPTKKALEKYLETEKPQEKMLTCKNVGDKFSILGVEFTKEETWKDGLIGENPIVLSYIDHRGKKDTFGTFAGYTNLLEEVFTTITKGHLLYF